jgi:protein-disulfide isomerase
VKRMGFGKMRGRIVVVLAIYISIIQAVTAQSTDPQTSELRREVEAIKKEVSEIRKALDELRQSIQRSTPPPRPAAPAKVSVVNKPALGKPDAPVTLVEFSDYQCPFCRRHVTSTFVELKKDYVDSGKVRYVYRDFPIDQIHPEARKAAEAAHCAGDQGKYWEMHEVLFAKQRQLKPEDLKVHAGAIGVDRATFDACLDQGKYAKAVNDDEAAGTSVGVTGTPTFFIGKTGADGTIEGTRLVGAQPMAAFRRVIDQLLAQ